MPRTAITQLANLIGQELESRVGPSDWPDTLRPGRSFVGRVGGLPPGGRRIRTLGPGCEKAASSGNGTRVCRTSPHFQRRMMALEESFRFSHSACSSSGIFVSVSGYPRQR
jgi:hypothetical protein